MTDIVPPTVSGFYFPQADFAIISARMGWRAMRAIDDCKSGREFVDLKWDAALPRTEIF